MTVTNSASSTPLDKRSSTLPLKELVLFGILGAMTFAAKLIMAGLPNIEPVSLMVMLFAVVFGKKGIFPVYVYVFMEFAVYGIQLWSINYLYIWLILAVAAWLCRSMTHPLAWALLSGLFGLFFGALCAPVDIFIGGFSYALAKWVNGIPFDLLHCAGNFVIALILFVPLRKLLTHLYGQMQKA